MPGVLETVREAVTGSAESLKSLKSPVRLFARSGIKVTTVSQAAMQNLIDGKAVEDLDATGRLYQLPFLSRHG